VGKSSIAVAGLLLVQFVSSAGAASVQSQNDPLGHRLKLSLFRYAGTEEGEPKIHFSRFKGILRDKLTVLVEELSGPGENFEYLRRLSLDPDGEGGLEDRLTTEDAVQNYWAQSRSLILFRGSLFSEDSKSYFAQSRLYLGDLSGDLPHASIAVRLPIQSDEFATTNDTHSLAVYYVLAQDAMRMHDYPSRVIELLSHAQDKVRDLKVHGALPPALVELEDAIERALVAQKQLQPPQ